MLRELGLCSLERRRLRRILSKYINPWREGVRKMESDPFQWCPATEQEPMGTNWTTIILFKCKKKFVCFLFEEWPSTGTVCPERLWSFHPWRYSKPRWTQPWATCFEQMGWTRHTQRCLPTSAILQFCDPPSVTVTGPFDNIFSKTQRKKKIRTISIQMLAVNNCTLGRLEI